MKHRQGEAKIAGAETEWTAWMGGKVPVQTEEKEGPSHRILGASRGRAKIYFMAADNDDPQAGEAAGNGEPLA